LPHFLGELAELKCTESSLAALMASLAELVLKNLTYLGPVIRYCPILCFGFAASKGYDYPR